MFLRRLTAAIACLALFIMPQAVFAAESAYKLAGDELGLIWGIPFAGMLLSIAVFPLIAPDFWHHNFGKVAGFWALCFLGPCLILLGWQTSVFIVLEVLFHEYLPFILLLFALFTVAGGVRLKEHWLENQKPTPLFC